MSTFWSTSAGSASRKREGDRGRNRATFAVNHLRPFCSRTCPARPSEAQRTARSSTSSIEHRRDLTLRHLQFEKGRLRIVRAYARSKLRTCSSPRSWPVASRHRRDRQLSPSGRGPPTSGPTRRVRSACVPLAKLFMLSAEQAPIPIVYLPQIRRVEGLTGATTKEPEGLSVTARPGNAMRRGSGTEARLVGLPPDAHDTSKREVPLAST